MTVLVPERPNRRDFLSWASYSLLGIGAVAATWPFIDSMNPTPEDVENRPGYLDLSGLAPGKIIEAMWRKQPVIILRRTAAQLAQLEQSHPAMAALRGSNYWANSHRSPIYTMNWHRSIDPAIFVVVRLCNFEGCAVLFGQYPLGISGPGSGSDAFDFVCPCCGTRFDLAGRRFNGPAPDLDVPPYGFGADRNHLFLGEAPPA